MRSSVVEHHGRDADYPIAFAQTSVNVLLDLRRHVELGTDAEDGESYGRYAARVWDIGEVSDSDVVPGENEARRGRQAGRQRPRS